MRQALVSTIVVLGLVAAAPGAAAFPGADGRVVLSSGRDLLTVLPDGSALQPLTATPGVEEAQASWSPDGSRVAFRVGTAGTSDVLQIAVMNADGSGRTVLTGGDHHSSQPGWSPDGRQIVFRRSVPGVDLSGDIWVMGADGSSPHPLLALPGDERYPSLSPDGTRLAFTTHPAPTDDVEIAVALVDGGALDGDHRQRRVRLLARRGRLTAGASRSSEARRATTPATTSGRWPRTAPTSAS